MPSAHSTKLHASYTGDEATTAREPIAITGIGCRFPGDVNNPQQCWQMLRNGVDAIGSIPPDRWHMRAFYDPDPAKPGKTYARWGGFINGIDRFDAQFFGMSPREATRADPQQRVLMEVAYEALEDAGLPPQRIAGTNTGVFVGIATLDYGGIQSSPTERAEINAYTNLGLAMCIAANRISYFFDLHGPSFAVDTACSSSLVAMHLACESIWNGESELALAGGVNLILRPEGTIGFSKASMLSPDGRCKSFDARANGYVRSEGAAMLVLKPLSSALADNDPIYAVVRGTAINQDGRTTGISLPNGAAQAAILRDVYRKADVAPHQVQYVEAHGTGTPAGDPIELKAIGEVLSHDRADDAPLIVGSVKSNMGHLEAASGMAGVIKAALSIKHGQIPPNLHFLTPNPDIPFADLKIKVPQTLQPWPDTGAAPRTAGINSFGFGGTNAHVIVAEAPSQVIPEPEASAADRPVLLPLSARSSEALDALVGKYKAFVQNDAQAGVPLAGIAYSASMRRGHHDHRLAIVAQNKTDLAEQLQAYGDGETRPNMAFGRAVGSRTHNVAWVFGGMGQQWWAMGRQLLEGEPVFRQTVQRIDKLLREHVSWSLINELQADEARSRINETQIAQPAIFALQVGLAALWRSWGVEPHSIVGHSVGEVAAAHVAGALSLYEAVKLIYHRSRLQAQTAGQGAMLAIGMSADEAQALLHGYEDRVSVAAINSPTDVTLSGDTTALEKIAESLSERSVFNRFLQVEVPYHSPKMAQIKNELLQSLEELDPCPPVTPLFSTATGKAVAGPDLDAAYWWGNVRNPVQFAAAIDAMVDAGATIFLELSAHPVLGTSIGKCVAHAKHDGAVLPSLRRQEMERATMLGSLGKLYTLGYPIDWSKQYPNGGRFVRLPAYPWQHERFWHESEQSERTRLGTQVHPLLGNQLNAAMSVWSAELDTQALPYLRDHCIQNTVMFPAAGYVEMALAATAQAFGAGAAVVENLSLQRAMFLPPGTSLPVQLIKDGTQTTFDVYSRAPGGDGSWTRHASGKLRRAETTEAKQIALDTLRSRLHHEVTKNEFYEQFRRMGLEYGPAFQGVERLWIGDGEALGQITLPAGEEADLHNYYLHPAMLDAGFHVLLGAVALHANGDNQATATYLPVQIERIQLHQKPPRTVYSYARLAEVGQSFIKGDLQLVGEDGTVLAAIQGFVCRAIESGGESWDNYLYEYQWKPKARAEQHAALRSAGALPTPTQIVERLQGDAERLAEHLDRQRYYEELVPQNNVLAQAYIVQALRQLGWQPQLNQQFTTDALADQLGVVAQQRRLWARLLLLLAEDGILQEMNGAWNVITAPTAPAAADVWRDLWLRFPAYQAELTLIRQCGERLADVLRGAVDPLQLIFPNGSSTTAEHLYGDAPSYRIYNMLAQKAVAEALDHLPAGRTVRLLEIGGGTGGMTGYVLRKLPANRSDYVFTDVTPVLVAHAEQKFHEYPFVQYQVLDIEQNPLAQGFEAHAFDLILASDVLHATTDLAHTLGNVKQLLASEGMLVLLEGIHTPRSVMLVFGLLKGWWLFTDTDVRGLDPWIDQAAWERVLRGAGFSDVAYLVDTPDAPRAVHSVILARGPVIDPAAQNGHVAAPPTERGTWVIFADKDGAGQQVAKHVAEQGAAPLLVSPGGEYKQIAHDHWQIRPTDKADLAQLFAHVLADHAPVRGVIHLWSLDAASHDLAPAAPDDAQDAGSINVLYLAQTLADLGSDPPQLWLVTGGAHFVNGDTAPVAVAQAPLWGLGRVIMNEYGQLRTRQVDLSAAPSPDELRSLAHELIANDDEDEIALRGEARYVHRLRRTPLLTIGGLPHEQPTNNDRSFAIEIGKPGLLDSLTARATARRAPNHGEIEIAVEAAGLNFKDVMISMGLLPDEALEGGYTGKALGMECAGTVIAVGSGVDHIKVGDRVFTSAPGSLRTHLTIDARFVVPKPDHISFEEAATIPITFLTAYYSLNYLGRMQRGDRVLIHAAAGGVGLAAIQLAQRAGADVFATAGTPGKRALLRALGVKYVMDSRSLAFADQVMEFTGGKGVDIVLNSLAGEAIGKSLGVLSPYGRFIEIGKRDIYEDSKVGLRPFRNNLSYFAVDLDKLCAQRPDMVQGFLQELMDGFHDGSLRPLPYRVFGVGDVVAAFRYMAQAKHTGKVVVSMMDGAVHVAPPVPAPFALRDDGTYLIAGGLGGFGLAVAQWLADHGAKHVVLVGRSGARTKEAAAVIDALCDGGVEVVVAKGDIAQESDVARVLGEIEHLPPLRGVIHAAMVLDDGLLMQLDADRMRTAMAPKVAGAWNLHTHTRELALDFFVAFSSFTSMIGNPGQGNYVAANAFLDALAFHRRQQGLPALTVNWGAVAGVGYVAQNPEVGQKLEHVGVRSMPADQLLRILGELLRRDAVQVGVSHIDWPQLAKVHLIQSTPRFAHFMEAATGEDGDAGGASLVDALMAVEPNERHGFLTIQIRDQLARVLGTSPAKLDTEQSLLNLGIDSLMAVEIGNQIQAMVGVDVPTMKFMEGLSIAGLSTYVIEQLAPAGNDAGTAAADAAAPSVDAQVDQLSDAEVDALLQEMVAANDHGGNGSNGVHAAQEVNR